MEYVDINNQRTNGPINAHLTIGQVLPQLKTRSIVVKVSSKYLQKHGNLKRHNKQNDQCAR